MFVYCVSCVYAEIHIYIYIYHSEMYARGCTNVSQDDASNASTIPYMYRMLYIHPSIHTTTQTHTHTSAIYSRYARMCAKSVCRKCCMRSTHITRPPPTLAPYKQAQTQNLARTRARACAFAAAHACPIIQAHTTTIHTTHTRNRVHGHASPLCVGVVPPSARASAHTNTPAVPAAAAAARDALTYHSVGPSQSRRANIRR